MFDHNGVPTKRAGIPTLRQASINITDSPVQDATPVWMVSDGAWPGRLRFLEYLTPVCLKIWWFNFAAASPVVSASLIKFWNRA